MLGLLSFLSSLFDVEILILNHFFSISKVPFYLNYFWSSSLYYFNWIILISRIPNILLYKNETPLFPKIVLGRVKSTGFKTIKSALYPSQRPT